MLRALVASLFVAFSADFSWAVASFSQTKASYLPSDTLILDRHGETLHRLRSDNTVRRGQWVALADVSPALRAALVLSEDQRFYEHSGVDWQAVSGAAWANLWNAKTRGASTLTMQLAGLLDENLRRNTGGRSVLQKLEQTVSAQSLERSWRKDQILEAYLNLVPFRGELVGIDALSRTLFGKAAHGLDQREAAVAAALVRAPNSPPALVTQRACAVLKSLQARPSAGMATQNSADLPGTCDALDLFTAAALQRRDFAPSEGIAPHLARRLVTELSAAQANSPVKQQAAKPSTAALTSTLRAPLQRFAVQTLQQHLRELAGRHVEDGALVVLDNRSAQVLAWVGSSGELSRAAEVDGVTALRQPGSTLKPFLYAQALAERRITAASLLDDSGTQIQTTGGLYIPQNYDHQFKGWVSARTALGASLNVPSVRTLALVSPDAFHKQLVKLGLPLKESGDYYGYSLALGSAEVSLLNLTNAYRTLANGGRASPVRVSLQPQATGRRPSAEATQALDPRAAFIVGDILSDPLARARSFGTDSVLGTRYWTAVKTGTSKDMRDNWAIGYSQAYTVGVWVGNASGAPMWDVSGTTGAAPIWAAMMNYLHARQPSHAPQAPPGLVEHAVRFATPSTAAPLEATRKEWFLDGTQQAVFAIDSVASSSYPKSAKGQKDKNFSSAGMARITSPATGTIIALDPDIPPKLQRVTLTAEGTNLHWIMDGKLLAKGATVQWLPWPGRHVVQLRDGRGQVQDEIRLEVRGAGLRASPANPASIKRP